MRAQDAVKYLSELNPDEEVMIEWFGKEDVESHMQYSIPDEQWNLAVRLFEKSSGDQDNFEIQYFLGEAKERLAAAE